MILASITQSFSLSLSLCSGVSRADCVVVYTGTHSFSFVFGLLMTVGRHKLQSILVLSILVVCAPTGCVPPSLSKHETRQACLVAHSAFEISCFMCLSYTKKCEIRSIFFSQPAFAVLSGEEVTDPFVYDEPEALVAAILITKWGSERSDFLRVPVSFMFRTIFQRLRERGF